MGNVQTLPTIKARPPALFLCKTCMGGERTSLKEPKPVCKDCGGKGMVLR